MTHERQQPKWSNRDFLMVYRECITNWNYVLSMQFFHWSYNTKHFQLVWIFEIRWFDIKEQIPSYELYLEQLRTLLLREFNYITYAVIQYILCITLQTALNTLKYKFAAPSGFSNKVHLTEAKGLIHTKRNICCVIVYGGKTNITNMSYSHTPLILHLPCTKPCFVVFLFVDLHISLRI